VPAASTATPIVRHWHRSLEKREERARSPTADHFAWLETVQRGKMLWIAMEASGLIPSGFMKPSQR
jgi:hypothetical protein